MSMVKERGRGAKCHIGEPGDWNLGLFCLVFFQSNLLSIVVLHLKLYYFYLLLCSYCYDMTKGNRGDL